MSAEPQGWSTSPRQSALRSFAQRPFEQPFLTLRGGFGQEGCRPLAQLEWYDANDIMTRPPLRGVLPIAPTPFTESGDVDYDGQRRVLDCMIDQGVDAICLLANFSEQFLLTDDERDRLAELCLTHVAGRVPVIVTCSHFSTRIAAERGRRAASLGASMLMLMPPYHGVSLRADENGILDHFAAVAEAARIPIMVQDAPLSGVQLSVPFLVQLAKSTPREFVQDRGAGRRGEVARADRRRRRRDHRAIRRRRIRDVDGRPRCRRTRDDAERTTAGPDQSGSHPLLLRPAPRSGRDVRAYSAAHQFREPPVRPARQQDGLGGGVGRAWAARPFPPGGSARTGSRGESAGAPVGTVSPVSENRKELDDMVSNSGSLLWYSLKGAAALFVATLVLAAGSVVPAQSRIKVLLVTGQSNRYHNWEVSSPIVKRQLEDSGRFAVTVATTPAKGAAPNQDMSSFAPKFSDYQAVVLDYEGFEFAPPVKQAFVDYVKNGGGLVVLHAADNAFPGWARVQRDDRRRRLGRVHTRLRQSDPGRRPEDPLARWRHGARQRHARHRTASQPARFPHDGSRPRSTRS